MAALKNVGLLLIGVGLGGGPAGYAQQGPGPGPGRPLSTPADTGAALHELFQIRRRSSGLFLAATPVAVLLTTAAAGALAVSSLSSTRPRVVLPVVSVLAGVGGTVALLNRNIRYTRGSEERLVSRYARTRRLPGWTRRALRPQTGPKP